MIHYNNLTEANVSYTLLGTKYKEENMKSSLPRPALAAGLTILLLLALPTLAFAGGQQVKEEEAPTLYWFTSVQGGREPSEQPLFEAEVERLMGIRVKILKTTEDYSTKLSSMEYVSFGMGCKNGYVTMVFHSSLLYNVFTALLSNTTEDQAQ